MALKDLKSIFNEGIPDKVTDFFQDTHAEGFTKGFIPGTSTKYVEDSSMLDIESYMGNNPPVYGLDNKYSDIINVSPNGLFFDKHVDLIQNSNNPLLINHWSSIGFLDSDNNQSVDFFGGNNSYFPNIVPEIDGFTVKLQHKSPTLFTNFTENSTLSNMGELLEYRKYPISDDDYSPPEKLYNTYNYDPRYPDDDVLTYNKYKGSIYDDPLTLAGGDYPFGGGLFNNATYNKYSKVFRENPYPSIKTILEKGSMVGDGGSLSQLPSLEKFENKTGIEFSTESGDRDFISLGTPPSKYFENNVINLSASSWYYNGSIQDWLPDINDYVTPVLTSTGKRSNSLPDGSGKFFGKLAGDDLFGESLNSNLSFQFLYNKNHTSLFNDRLNITFGTDETGIRGIEPYIISNILSLGDVKPTLTDIKDNTDKRMKEFLKSNAGQNFKDTNTLASKLQINPEKLTGWNWEDDGIKSLANISDGASGAVTDTIPLGEAEKYIERALFKLQNKFRGRQSEEYEGADLLSPMVDYVFQSEDLISAVSETAKRLIAQGYDNSWKKRKYEFDGIRKRKKPNKKSLGDLMTLTPINRGKFLKMAYYKTDNELESEKSGMPFYFKDLRDNSFIFFRAYLDSITENLAPSWNEENYVGRSEPVYVYNRTSRDISFTLKMFAHSEDEFVKLYEKLNKLSSLCYPRYAGDAVNFPGNIINLPGQNVNAISSTRPKPPLTKLRIGELYGTKDNELMGFLRSLTYSFPDGATWETRQGMRAPKHIVASVTYQVIHQEVPNRDTKFFGIRTKQQIHRMIAERFVDILESGVRSNNLGWSVVQGLVQGGEDLLRNLGQIQALKNQEIEGSKAGISFKRTPGGS